MHQLFSPVGLFVKLAPIFFVGRVSNQKAAPALVIDPIDGRASDETQAVGINDNIDCALGEVAIAGGGVIERYAIIKAIATLTFEIEAQAGLVRVVLQFFGFSNGSCRQGDTQRSLLVEVI